MYDIEARVYSRVKNKYPQNLKQKFPDTFFTRDNRVKDDPQFPTVYVHQLSSVEQGQDLQNDDICAILSTFQIEVTDNESMDNAKEVMDNVCKTMKSMRFSIVSMPEFRNTQDVYRIVGRFRRLIASLDTL